MPWRGRWSARVDSFGAETVSSAWTPASAALPFRAEVGLGHARRAGQPERTMTTLLPFASRVRERLRSLARVISDFLQHARITKFENDPDSGFVYFTGNPYSWTRVSGPATATQVRLLRDFRSWERVFSILRAD